jgi:nitrogen fixation protein NifB
MEQTINTPFAPDNHPCFNPEARHRTARIHLPVAGRCNIQCGFCSRKYDCVNESRPGVTSAVLRPQEALSYLEAALEKIEHIAVVGIAGPGDPFATPEATLETLRLVRERHPAMLLCVATNGLGLPPYAAELAALNVSHVTVTVNAAHPVIGMKIYEWVAPSSRTLRGINGARFLLERQAESVRLLKASGITVKINTVVVPGINDKHTDEIASWAAKAGADIHNFIPVLPVPGTLFASVASPGPAEMAAIRLRAGRYLPQMSHCARCRADAAGLLGADTTAITSGLMRCAGKGCTADPAACRTPRALKPYVAVATRDGVSINEHLGRSAAFYVFGEREGRLELIEIREAPPEKSANRWPALAQTLADCFAVLTAASGPPPKRFLAEAGITVYDTEGPIAPAALPLFEASAAPIAGRIARRRESDASPSLSCRHL